MKTKAEQVLKRALERYVPASKMEPDYLARRMAMYRQEVEEERAAEAELHQQRMAEMGAWQ